MPGLRVGVVIWQMPKDVDASGDRLSRPPDVDPRKLAEAAEIGADFVVTGIEEAMVEAFKRADARPVTSPVKHRPLRLAAARA
jgi:hypothetical protein